MELSWSMKLRIAAAAAVGIVLIGIFSWPVTSPSEMTGAVSFSSALTLALLSLLAGFVGFFVSWPYGREIGILAAPFGLAVWAVRSGTMATLLQANPGGSDRIAVLQSLKWQPVLWLIIVAAGFAGPLLFQKMFIKTRPSKQKAQSRPNPVKHLSPIIAIGAAAFVAYLCVGIFAQDVRLTDDRLGAVMVQSAMGQLGFAVLMAFGIAAFVVRKLLGVSYIWPIIASVFVTAFATSSYTLNADYLAQQWPAVFFSNAAASVLPCQMVAFGTLGSIAGFWMAARYDYWRKYEM